MAILQQEEYVFLALGIIFSTVVARLFLARRVKHTLPPGPTPNWLGTNFIPREYPWRYFYTLSQKYGPLVTVWSGGRPSVICSDVETATFFLEKHARDTADRPRSIFGDEIFSHSKRILLVGHNERWRRLRKALHNPLQPQASKALRSFQEEAGRGVVLDILDTPGSFQSHIQTYAASLVVHMAYGRVDTARYSDPDIQKVVLGSHRLGTLLRPGYASIESFPWLRYIPGYLREVNRWAADELALFRGALAGASTTQPCFATYLLEHQQSLGLSSDEIAYLCGSVFGAGSDTSASAITICVMAAAVAPQAQKAVQKELDSICGDRSPTFDDIEDSQVLRAFVAESFRWRPVSSGGFQHRTTSDIVYGEYTIPAGTTISGNHWAIHRDEGYYGRDVEAFNIDRWLTGGRFNNKKHFQFGFGRRVCPGQHVALNSVLINAALLLWSFDITPKGDIDTLAFTNTANSHPLPFAVHFTPRHEKLRQVVEREIGSRV